jgi:shikimate kinase
MSGRPLSTDVERLKNMYNERKDMYGAFSDFTVSNDGEVQATVKGIIDKL